MSWLLLRPVISMHSLHMKTDLVHLNTKILNNVKILKELLFDASCYYVLEETLCYFEAQRTFITLYAYLTYSTQSYCRGKPCVSIHV